MPSTDITGYTVGRFSVAALPGCEGASGGSLFPSVPPGRISFLIAHWSRSLCASGNKSPAFLTLPPYPSAATLRTNFLYFVLPPRTSYFQLQLCKAAEVAQMIAVPVRPKGGFRPRQRRGFRPARWAGFRPRSGYRSPISQTLPNQQTMGSKIIYFLRK